MRFKQGEDRDLLLSVWNPQVQPPHNQVQKLAEVLGPHHGKLQLKAMGVQGRKHMLENFLLSILGLWKCTQIRIELDSEI